MRQETKTINIYKFEELSENAKQKAIENFNALNNWENYDQSFTEFLKASGYENVKTYYSGFYSQGDGACFVFKSLDFDKFFTACEGWGEYSELHNNFLTSYPKLIRQIKRIKDILFYRQSHRGQYYHSKSVMLEYELDVDLNRKHSTKHSDKYAEAFEKVLRVLNQELANLYYKDLQSDYEYQQSEEYLAEYFANDDYEFLENGEVY